MVTGMGGLPSALRGFADDLNVAAARLAGVLTSLAGAIEAREGGDDPWNDTGGAPADRPSEGRAPAAAKRTARPRARARPAPASPAPARSADGVTTETVRAAIVAVGPATAAQIADHINSAAGRRVVDGRSIRGHARSAGARIVMRGGERCYRL